MRLQTLLPSALLGCIFSSAQALPPNTATPPPADTQGVRHGQDAPLSPEESLRRIQLDGPYEAQLVAAEPLVLDPVECTWDSQGRLLVADMRDYPLGPAQHGAPWLSRIQLLLDDDGDGRMDRAITFADHLDHVQGLLPYQDGLIATTRTQILFLRDTNQDQVADEIRPLILGFNPTHSQLQVSSPRWGRDGCVYFNNGLDTKEIYPAESPSSPVAVPGVNFKWDPATGQITPTGGRGQYGAAFDDWGHHFSCSNRNPLMFTVLPYSALKRNPHAGITQTHEDIAPSGPETRVYPLQITHTTADAHAGTNTACSGLGVYRGRLMPGLRNNVFVPDPTGQLITRYQISPLGASLQASRSGNRTEFFRSSDQWTRPVNITTGPDDALYVCDIYRQWIDHARFFPDEFVKTHDIRSGEHHGRIWRIVPKGSPRLPRPDSGRYHATPWPEPAPAEHPERALLLQIPSVSDPAALASILSKHADDPWISRMTASAAQNLMGRVLAGLDPDFFATLSDTRAATLRTFAAGSVADAHPGDLEALLSLLRRQPGELLWWKPPLLQGLARLTKPDAATAREIAALASQIDRLLADPSAPTDIRLALVPLLGSRPWPAVAPVLGPLLRNPQPQPILKACVAVLQKFPAPTTAPLLHELLPGAGPALKRDLATLLLAHPATALDLLQRMEKGELPMGWVDVEKRWGLQRGNTELADLARRLFGQTQGNRGAVVSQYLASTGKPGDSAKGRAIFSSLCTGCHRLGDLGSDVGPSLADLRSKPPEALLSDILDPNRMFEARWSGYQITTHDGRALAGLIRSETPDSVVLVLPGGSTETLARTAIREMRSLDRTLMPEGFESAIPPEQMPDLLSFLLGR